MAAYCHQCHEMTSVRVSSDLKSLFITPSMFKLQYIVFKCTCQICLGKDSGADSSVTFYQSPLVEPIINVVKSDI